MQWGVLPLLRRRDVHFICSPGVARPTDRPLSAWVHCSLEDDSWGTFHHRKTHASRWAISITQISSAGFIGWPAGCRGLHLRRQIHNCGFQMAAAELFSAIRRGVTIRFRGVHGTLSMITKKLAVRVAFIR